MLLLLLLLMCYCSSFEILTRLHIIILADEVVVYSVFLTFCFFREIFMRSGLEPWNKKQSIGFLNLIKFKIRYELEYRKFTFNL